MNTTPLTTLLTCLLFAPFAQAAPDPASSGREAPIDEVIITAARANIVKLAQQVRMAEFRFYQRYNELNTKPDYVVNCRNEASTGSRFTWDECRPKFQDNARETEGRQFVNVLQSTSVGPAGIAITSTPAAPSSMAIAAGRPGFQKNMADITRKNPDLLELLNEYQALVKRYEDAYRVRNGAKPSTEERTSAPAMPAPSSPTNAP